MADEAMEAAKAALRKEARAIRAALPATERAAAAEAASRHFLDSVSRAPEAVVACYWPIRDELDCRPILVALMEAGQPVCLPVTQGDAPLVMRRWVDGEPLYPSGFGTLAPSELAPVATPDIVIIPLLGFDATGTRLGYGKGHYDRTLALMERRPTLVGLAFSAQEFEAIPRAEHDLPLDAIVTETGVRHFARAAA